MFSNVALAQEDYNENDVIQFVKEELERIITQYPLQKDGGALSDAQAFETWFLHQELGIDYTEAVRHILDGPNDCGVDFIVVDDNNHQVIVGQSEYDLKWSRLRANKVKATKTFAKFRNYLTHAKMPDELPEFARDQWRLAKKKINSRYNLRYLYVTPKHLRAFEEEDVRIKSGISNYDFVTHDILVSRGQEFIDGQTGMCNFELTYKGRLLKTQFDFGKVYVATVDVRQINEIVTRHKELGRLRALFASNVRTYLSKKKRSKDIADAMKITLKQSPQEFFVCNNGITIQCSKATPRRHSMRLERASISNGCQTAMNIHSYFQENEGSAPVAQVLVTVVELSKDASRLAGEIARSRNNQNPVNNRDLMSNNFRLVCLHHRLLADLIAGSERRYYLLRKEGEKQTLLKERPEARGEFLWIDAALLAQCIAAIIRQNPYMSQEGISDLFGKDFNKIFPDVADPTHSRCKYSWWLYQIIYYSYGTKTRWKGVTDKQIYFEKDFKNPAIWVVAAFLAKKLRDDLSFDETFEQRFVTKCERWWYKARSAESEEFRDLAFRMIDDAYRLLHSICRKLLGKKLPDIYSTYDDLLKAPSAYQAVLSAIRKGRSKTYQSRLDGSMRRLFEYLKIS